ncbi:ethionine resistance protein [Rhinocladiella similis]
MPPTEVDETAPLLAESTSGLEYKGHEFNIWTDLVQLTRQSLPICLSFALQNVVQALSVLMAGSLGSFEMKVTSYGFMFFSCTGTMIAIGGATALDTMCAQAFTSHTAANNPKILGVLLQQCLLVLLGIFGILVIPLWVFSGPIFVSLGQERDFALATGKFMLFMLPAGVLQVVAECIKKFIQVQGASSAVGWATAAASALGVLSTGMLVRWSSLNLWAITCGFCLYQMLTVLALAFLILTMPAIKSTWSSSVPKFSRELSLLLFYAITGILTIATEWWSFEILAMMAARLDPDSIGAQSILMSSDLLFTTISLGISVASSHRIGGLLGAGQGSLAKRAIATPYLLSLIVGAIEFVGIMLARDHYGRIFTDDMGVIKTTAKVIPLMAGFQVLDLSNGGAGGILRGAGKNHLSGACNFLAYYGVGLTSAWFLCFRKGYGIFGLWAGIITGSGALLVLQSACLLGIDWRKLAQKVSSAHAE